MQASGDSISCGTNQALSLRPMFHSTRIAMTTFLSDTDVVDRPIRIFGGTRDDYNPISACKAYVERLRTAGSDVELTEYPNASHAFDNPLGAQPAKVQPTFESVRNCKIREEAGGLLMNTDTGPIQLQGCLRRTRPTYWLRSPRRAGGQRRGQGSVQKSVPVKLIEREAVVACWHL